MKRLKVWIMTTVILVVFSVAFVFAETPKITGSASLGVYSNYVWRGQKLSNSFVIQPSIGFTAGAVSANIWANLDSDFNDSFELTETDFTIDYAFSVDRFNFNVGYIYYALESAADTQEFYFSVGYDVLLNPSLTVYYDFDEGDGGFAVLSVGHSVGVMADMVLNVGASVSYNFNNEVMGYDERGEEFSNFYNAELSASLSIPVSAGIAVEPVVAYSFALSDDAEYALQSISDDADDSVVYAGVTVSFNF